MYRSKGSGGIVYETVEELLNAEIVFVSEYEGFYYVKLKPQEFYDNSIWKVDKRTGEVSYMMFTEYIGIYDIATPVDPAMLRKLRKGA